MPILYKIIGGSVAAVILAGAAWFAWTEIKTLRIQNTELTLKIKSAMDALDKVAEHSGKTERAVSRIEAADAKRQNQLRGFERRLAELAGASAELRQILSVVIPDSATVGLRSARATPGHPDHAAASPGAAAHAP